MAGFEYVSNDHLNTMEKIDLQALLMEISVGDLQQDLRKIDHIFLVEGGVFREISVDEVGSYVKNSSIEFMEYESN